MKWLFGSCATYQNFNMLHAPVMNDRLKATMKKVLKRMCFSYVMHLPLYSFVTTEL